MLLIRCKVDTKKGSERCVPISSALRVSELF